FEDLEPASFGNKKVKYREFTEAEKREIIFRDITTGDINHTTELDVSGVIDFSSVAGYYAKIIKDELRLVGGYDILYGKVKEFIVNYLFDKSVDIEDINTLRNLSELEAAKTIIETFKKKINELTILDKGSTEIRDYIKLRQTRPFVVKEQG
ncbi:MAG TPA: type III restriction endonuclease subunit R, partial [Spirochaetota bacterium]|nr:type III restriction endonuclease subunit R [Spirochaetota bacterium]